VRHGEGLLILPGERAGSWKEVTVTKATAAILACSTLIATAPASALATPARSAAHDAPQARHARGHKSTTTRLERREQRALHRAAVRRRLVHRGARAVRVARSYLGVPYRYGGTSRAGFDCSGLVMAVYARLGVQLDHYTGSQWHAGRHVRRSALRPGDLVFFDGSAVPGHVGIYAGRGRFIHAPHTGTVVSTDSLATQPGYVGAVRPSL
jgi:cell wall-associated NlpC family hydrolase